MPAADHSVAGAPGDQAGQAAAGELIEVPTSDPEEAQDLSVWARATRNRLVQQTKDDGVYRFVLGKR